MTGLALFAYGSLVGPKSAAMTLGRQVRPAGFATLAGWARGWTVCRDNFASEKTFARADGSLPRFCLGLGVEPDRVAPAPNGLLIEVTDAELVRLDLRELRYRRVEVTGAVAAGREAGRGAGRSAAHAAPETAAGTVAAFDRVFAYRPRPEHRRPRPPPDAIVVAAYLRAVEAAFAALGTEHLDRFRATTGPPPVEVCEVELVGDRIPAGNPRAW